MYKFKTSKYKNALPKVPKKEGWILDISVGSPQSHGNHIKASAAFMAFNCDARGGGSLGVLSLDTCGRIRKDHPMLHCHSELVTDFDFSPFDDGLLATGSQDCSVKVWRIPEGGLTESLVNPAIVLPAQVRRIENVVFHPTADCGLTVSSSATVSLWDLSSQKCAWDYDGHNQQVLSLGWKEDGTLLSTLSKDKMLRILDPRTNLCAQETPGHQNPKDGRIVWLGTTDRILTTGFNASHQRQVCMRDIRNIAQPLKLFSPDTSTGILIPLFDSDTCMLFLAGKADSSVIFLEVIDSDPFLTEASRHTCEQPIKGACLIPKRALNVMQCEVNRLLQLTTNAIIPVTYQVPRKTFRDFHGDLFPDTTGPSPAMTFQDWLGGENIPVPKISLNPSVHQCESLLRFCKQPNTDMTMDVESVQNEVAPPLQSELNDEVFSSVLKSTPESRSVQQNFETKGKANGQVEPSDKLCASQTQSLQGPVPLPRRRRTSSTETDRFGRSASVDSTGTPPVAAPRVALRKSSREESSGSESDHRSENRQNGSSSPGVLFGSPGSPLPVRSKILAETASNSNSPAATNGRSGKSPKVFPGFRTSKFRHLKGAPLHRSAHIENVRNLSTAIPGECDGFHANKDRVAVPLKGPGGKIAIFELSKPGRLPDGIVPVIQNGTTVTDFAWDPFNNGRLVVACDDAKIRVWSIPEGGLRETITIPDNALTGHTEKIYFVKFHPLAKDVLASGSYDLTICIWDLLTSEEKLRLSGHTDQIFSLSWSQDGRYLATVCKDNKLRVYEPRVSVDPIKEGVGPVGNRGARILWALDGKFLVVTGFDRVSERQVAVYDLDNLAVPLTTVGLDVSPAILIPFYDEDSSTLFLTGKGDTTIYAYEVCVESPFLFPLSHHKCSTSHQALGFLPKSICNVKDVEFARALRLTPTTIEPLSFTVPRVKTEFFQNDLFPDTRVTWEPAVSSTEWFNGKDNLPKYISLQPEGMKPLTENVVKQNVKPVEVKPASTQSVFLRKGKADLTTLFATMAIGDGDPLPQETMEGVESKEWDE